MVEPGVDDQGGQGESAILVCETDCERVGLVAKGAGIPAVCFVPSSGYDRRRVLAWARGVLMAATSLPLHALMSALALALMVALVALTGDVAAAADLAT